MNIRLKIASLWLPNFILEKELDNVAVATIDGLNDVMKKYIPWRMEEIIKEDEILKGALKERRAIMARAHSSRVKALIEELGHENAIQIARKSMYNVGRELGQEARQKLGVGNNLKDLELAAKILYRILGIEFKIENKDGNTIMIVNRCVLSKYYSSEACIVLSAVDEGVVNGLNENMNLKFRERITEGSSECIACINKVET